MLVISHATAHVFEENRVDDAHDLPRRRIGTFPRQGRDDALNHEHDETRLKSMTRYVANADPAPLRERHHIVIVAPDLRRGNHLGRELEARNYDGGRKDARLNASRNLHFLFESVALRALATRGLEHDLLDEPRPLSALLSSSRRCS